MKPFFKNLLNALIVLLWMGGVIISLVLTIKVGNVAAILSAIVLSVLSFPTVRRIVMWMNDLV